MLGIFIMGGFRGADESPDWTEYPFVIESVLSSGTATNYLSTETAGNYVIAVSENVEEVSENFKNAIATVVMERDFVIYPGLTTWEEAESALHQGKNVYFFPETSQKAIILTAIYDGQEFYVVYGIMISNGDLEVVTLSASSADGVLEN